MGERQGAVENMEGLNNAENRKMSFFRDKRILITGHTGFKGSWLSRILFDAGAKVTGVSLAPDKSKHFFQFAVWKIRWTVLLVMLEILNY